SKNLRARYKRSDHIKINSLEVYDKRDLSDGYMMAKDYIPENKMSKQGK
ncbi:modification methylase Sau96I, partial [Streptococcus canis]